MFSLSEGMHQMLIIFIAAPLAPTCCFGCDLVESACVCIDAESEVVECDCSEHADCCAVCGEKVDEEFIEMTADHEIVLVDGVYCPPCLRRVEVDCHDCDDWGTVPHGPWDVPCHCQPSQEELRDEDRFEAERQGDWI